MCPCKGPMIAKTTLTIEQNWKTKFIVKLD